VVGGESTLIFEDVFVRPSGSSWPGKGVRRFARGPVLFVAPCELRRVQGGNADVLLGATALLAEIHGTIKNGIVRDKLTEIVHLVETNFAGAIGSSALGKRLPRELAGGPALANTVKQNVTRFVYQVGRLTHDIAGGLLSTLPSDADFRSSEVGGLLEKYSPGSRASRRRTSGSCAGTSRG